MRRWEIAILAAGVAILLPPLIAVIASKLYAPILIAEAERILEG